MRTWRLPLPLLFSLGPLLLLHPSLTSASSTVHVSDPCTIKGTLHTQREWHGYLMSRVLVSYAKFVYAVSFPAVQGNLSLIMYNHEQLQTVNSSINCQERVEVADETAVIPLDLNPTSHCQTVEQPSAEGSIEDWVHCSGNKIIRNRGDADKKRWSIVIARCGQTGPLELQYTFTITGYVGDCEEDPFDRYKLPSEMAEEQSYETVTPSCHGNSGVRVTWTSQQRIVQSLLFLIIFLGCLP